MSQAGPLNVLTGSDAVISATGISPITVNGVSGVAEVGAITIGINGTGYVNTITATSPLTANGFSGVPEDGAITLALSGSGYVSSISGTANQIVVTPSTGHAVVSLTDGISLGAFASIPAPPGGILADGVVAFGTYNYNWLFEVAGSISINSTTYASVFDAEVSIGFGGTAVAAEVYINPLFVSGDGTMTSAYGLFIDKGNTNTVPTDGYSLYVTTPAYGTNLCATYSDNISIGYTGVTPPTNGLISMGKVGIGNSSPSATLTVTGTLSASTSVSTPIYLLTGSSSGTISILPQAAAGTYDFNLPTTAGTSGYFLTSAGGGSSPMTWTNPSSSLVTSISGTANQIVASASTGAVTLSFPATGGISIGSYQATTPPVGGIIAPGQTSIGASALTDTSNGKLEVHGGFFSTYYNSAGVRPATNGTNGGLAVAWNYTNSGAEVNFYNNFSSTPNIAFNFTYYNSTTTAYTSLLNFSNSTNLAARISWVNTNSGMGGGNIYGDTVYDLHLDTASNLTPISIDGSFVRIMNKLGVADAAPGTTLSVVGNAQIGFSSGTTAPSVGLAVSGPTAIGASAIDVGYFTINPTVTQRYAAEISGVNSNSGNNNLGSLLVLTTLEPSYSGTLNADYVASLYVYPNMRPASGCTINEAAGIYCSGGAVGGSGSVGHGYGGVFSNPAFGTISKCALYSDNASIGYTAITPPSEGLIVSGSAYFGTSSGAAGTSYQFTAASAYNTYFSGTQTTLDASDYQHCVFINSVMAPTNGATLISGLYINPAFVIPSGKSTSYAMGIYVNEQFASNVGTISNAYGIYINNGGASAGTITNGYGLFIPAIAYGASANFGIYVQQPSPAGTISAALYADNASIGYGSSSPPSNGLILSGQLGVNTSSVNSYSNITLNASYAHGLLIQGQQTPVDVNSIQTAIYLTPLFTPSSSLSQSSGVFCSTNFNPQSGATITTAYGMNLTAGSQGGAGSVTNGYTLHVTEPGFGTNTCALYTDNLSVGVAASGTPTAGTIRTAPPSSNTVTTAFGSSLTAGTALQNTTGYDILLNIVVSITAATGATLTLGVGPTSTPTTNAATGTLSVATIITLTAYVPNSYYVLVNDTGTITIGSITVVAMAV